MEKKRPERSDVEDVRREEASRGRRPIDLQTRRRREQLLRDFRKLLEFGTEEEFVAAMRALGLRDDSESFREALQICARTDLSNHLTEGVQTVSPLFGRQPAQVFLSDRDQSPCCVIRTLFFVVHTHLKYTLTPDLFVWRIDPEPVPRSRTGGLACKKGWTNLPPPCARPRIGWAGRRPLPPS